MKVPLPVYRNPLAPVEARVEDLVSRMTLEEKIDLLHGNEMETHANLRLGIPSLKMTDGPLGVRWNHSTAFPSAVLIGSSFDAPLVGRWASAMASETLAEGRDMLLAPCIEIVRAPEGGRNFETFGEDPFLTSAMVPYYIHGLQSHGVMASTKHFALNDQENDRMTIDVRADERTMMELHLPAFHAAVKAGTWSIMASYNRLNGEYATANSWLLKDILKEKWGFKGFVVSDWGATHDTVGAALGGMDLEMPQGDYFGGGKLLAAVREGKVTEAEINDKVNRLLRAMFAMGVFERKDADRPDPAVVDGPEHRQIAREAAQQGIVLLKNDGNLLPLQPAQGKLKVAVLGPNAATLRAGGGSSKVEPNRNISPLQGLRETGANLDVRYALGVGLPDELEIIESDALTPAQSLKDITGLTAEYFDNQNLEGEPVITRVDPKIDFSYGDTPVAPNFPAHHFSIRWTGKFTPTQTGTRQLAIKSDDGARVWLDGKLLIDDWNPHGPVVHAVPVELEAGRAYDLRVEYFEQVGGGECRLGFVPTTELLQADLEDAVALARQSDVAFVFVGYTDALESEGQDRESISLPAGQDELIRRVAEVNPRTVVVINAGGSVAMPWLKQVAGVIMAWYPGQEGGYALADLIQGRVNFSAKLPQSFYRRIEDSSSYGNYPGTNGQVHYEEGIFVGYRHLDRAKIEPLFPFGFGLSYTTFSVSNLQVTAHNNSASEPSYEVTANVTNTGTRLGAEVVQLYVGEQNPVVDRPVRELKGFQKIWLEPGQTGQVKFKLDAMTFAYYSVQAHDWRVNPGNFEISVGTSSRDLPLAGKVTLRSAGLK